MRKLLVFFMLTVALSVFAEEGVDIYTVTLPVENSSKGQQQIAFASGLHEVVDALNANSNLKLGDNFSQLFEHPEHYVESYSYLSDPEQPDTLQIVIHFDRQALRPLFSPQQTMQSQRLYVQVSGITSAESLNVMRQSLSQISAIKSLMIEQVSGDSVILLLVLQGSVTHLIQTLLGSQHFVSLNAEEDSERLRFKWLGK